MRRLLFTLLAVSSLCWCINFLESAQGERSTDWVRTVDGWEPSGIVTSRQPMSSPPVIHPALVASLQLGMSLFFLLAFPPNVGRSAKVLATPHLDVGSSLLVGA